MMSHYQALPGAAQCSGSAFTAPAGTGPMPLPARAPQYDSILGRGAFKTVYKAFDEIEGIEVAWNQVKVNDMGECGSCMGCMPSCAQLICCSTPQHGLPHPPPNACAVNSSSAERERLLTEIRVLKQLKHKNIMTFFDSWLDTKNMHVNFVTELFTSGTLRQ